MMTIFALSASLSYDDKGDVNILSAIWPNLPYIEKNVLFTHSYRHTYFTMHILL